MKTLFRIPEIRAYKSFIIVNAILLYQAFFLINMAADVNCMHSKPDTGIYKKEYIVEEIQKEFSSIFRIAIQSNNKGECIYFPNGINLDLPIKHYLFDFINIYYPYLTILQSHYTQLGDYIEFNSYFQKFDCKELEIRYNYYDMLKEDKYFNQYFLSLLNKYLKSNRSRIIDFSPIPTSEISIDSLMAVAKEFFDIGIMENGELEWLAAIWQNPYRKVKEDIKGSNAPLIAGFCFFAMHGDQAKLNNEILSNRKIIERKARFYLTSTGGIERYTFFYNELQHLMQNSEVLKAILINSYKKHKDVLNFKLVY